MSKLSVIIPAYNEELFIADAIKSVSFADEIIVIDSYSTDATAQYAKAAGCRVLQRRFDNFSDQKNYAIKEASGDWILFIDADERITQKLRIEIQETLANPRHNSYRLRFPHFFMNRFLYHKVDRVVRLVKNNGVYFTGDVHEKLQVKGTTGELKNSVIHYTYKGLFQTLAKKDSYAWFQAGMGIKQGKKVTYFHIVFKPLYRFFHTYIIKRTFMDGVPGLATASVDAYGVMSRYVKMMLLQKGLK